MEKDGSGGGGGLGVVTLDSQPLPGGRGDKEGGERRGDPVTGQWEYGVGEAGRKRETLVLAWVSWVGRTAVWALVMKRIFSSLEKRLIIPPD
jgi:hypothetical protein